jgi:AraC-like DNA-binding protein
LQAHFAQDIGVEELAKQAGLSRAHLTRAFSRHFGVPPHVYLNAVRLRHARLAMAQGCAPADVALDCGFADQSHLNRRFKGAMGMTAVQWMRQVRGDTR